MVYPYWTKDDLLREKMIDNRIFVAPYWPNVGNWCALKTLEFGLMTKMLPLPIYQRCSAKDMRRVMEILLN